MRSQAESHSVEDRPRQTDLKQTYSERYGIHSLNCVVLKHVSDVHAVSFGGKEPRPRSITIMGTGQQSFIAAAAKENLPQSEAVQLGEFVPKVPLFHNRQARDETDTPEKTYYTGNSVTNKWVRRSLTSPFAMKTMNDGLPRDGFRESEPQEVLCSNRECKRSSASRGVPRGSTELSGTFAITGDGSPGTAIRRRESGREFLHRRLAGFFDAAYGRLLEAREACTVPDVSRLEIRGMHWSKVRHAICERCTKTLDSKTPDLKLQDDHGSPDNVDTRTFQRTPSRRTVFRQPSRMDTRAEIKSDDLNGGETHTTFTSLMDDPLLVKISKKNRNVGKFTCKPESIPQAVCFEIRGAGLRHQDVKFKVEAIIEACPEVKVMAIQFHHRALINDQKDMNNRWIITTNSVAGRKCLSGNNLNFDGQVVKLLPYDEVINTEYQQFVRMRNFVTMMDSRNILC